MDRENARASLSPRLGAPILGGHLAAAINFVGSPDLALSSHVAVLSSFVVPIIITISNQSNIYSNTSGMCEPFCQPVRESDNSLGMEAANSIRRALRRS